MRTLGEIFHEDVYGNLSRIYLYDVLSIDALQTYTEGLATYTGAKAVNLSWCEDAFVDFYDHAYHYEYHAPQEERAINIAGSPGSCLTCRERVAVFMYSLSPLGRRVLSIPAPLHDILSLQTLQLTGETVTTLFNTLTGLSVVHRKSRLITPRPTYKPETV